VRREANPKRSAAWGRGRVAEAMAAVFLILKGYRILARRWASPGGEVDIVAKRGRCICFVEVKARATLESAAYALTERQRRHIAMAAEIWRGAHPSHADCDIRFDMILVTPGRLPHHIQGAFDDPS